MQELGSPTFTTTAANEHDLNQTKHLIHGDETFIGADSGYRGVQKREELKDVTAQWLIAEMPSKTKVLKKHPRINKNPIKTEFIKARKLNKKVVITGWIYV